MIIAMIIARLIAIIFRVFLCSHKQQPFPQATNNIQVKFIYFKLCFSAHRRRPLKTTIDIFKA